MLPENFRRVGTRHYLDDFMTLPKFLKIFKNLTFQKGQITKVSDFFKFQNISKFLNIEIFDS